MKDRCGPFRNSVAGGAIDWFLSVFLKLIISSCRMPGKESCKDRQDHFRRLPRVVKAPVILQSPSQNAARIPKRIPEGAPKDPQRSPKENPSNGQDRSKNPGSNQSAESNINEALININQGIIKS